MKQPGICCSIIKENTDQFISSCKLNQVFNVKISYAYKVAFSQNNSMDNKSVHYLSVHIYRFSYYYFNLF